MKRCVTLFACGVIAVAPLPADAREGFGKPQHAVQLDRRVLPKSISSRTGSMSGSVMTEGLRSRPASFANS